MPGWFDQDGGLTVGQRFFIGAATTEYSFEDDVNRPELAASLDLMRLMFSGLGYEVVSGFGLDMCGNAFPTLLRRFLIDPIRQATDIVVVYYTGHGIPAGSDLLLPACDTASDLEFSAMRATDLTGRLLAPADTVPLAVQQLLFILDTCHAANATPEMIRGVTKFLDSLKATAAHPSLAVMAGARPYELVEAGAYTGALSEAVKRPAEDGQEPEYLPLDALTGLIGLLSPKFQHARSAQVSERTAPFFPNPRWNRRLHGWNERGRQSERMQRQRETALTTHILPSAQGLHRGDRDDLWLFKGRENALRDLCQWLQRAQPTTAVVTGDPGSGKSALLSRLFVLADLHWRGRVPNLHLLPADTVPEPGTITDFIHARGFTSQELLAALSHACEVDAADSTKQFLTRLGRAGNITRTIIIDAVDEAVGRSESGSGLRSPVVTEVLAPLMSVAGDYGLRLLIGTRTNLLPSLGTSLQMLNLDDTRYADQPSLHAYVKACLVELDEASVYRHQPPELLDEIAEQIASASGNSFLVALIAARSHALQRTLVDPRDMTWRAGLAGLASDAMREDLQRRLLDQAPKARDLLLPLAYAESTGLPRGDLWPAMVTELTGRQCGNAELDWVIGHAGYYIVMSLNEVTPVYRLYHESLAENLRKDRNTTADQAAITDLLASRVPELPDGTADWGSTHPYIRAAFATHAAAGGRLDDYRNLVRRANRDSLPPSTADGPIIAGGFDDLPRSTEDGTALPA